MMNNSNVSYPYRLRFAAVRYLLLFLLSSITLSHTFGQSLPRDLDIYLIISSFNPDTKRATDFITEFESALGADYNENAIILVEDLRANNFSEEAWMWSERVEKLLAKYKNNKVRAIIAIGQEAWAALVAQKEFPEGVPVFGAHISSNGIVLPKGVVDHTWEGRWLNMSRAARRKGPSGGVVNIYLPRKTVELILRFFPNTRNIALLTDNTYGGISMKTLFIKEAEGIPNINFLYIDGREYYFTEIKERVKSLPENSALIIGTWKVNRDGQYYLNNTLEEIIRTNPNLPVFSMSGAGIGDGAIGGYIPRYGVHAKEIVGQIESYHRGIIDSVRFFPSGGVYHFDQRELNRLSIKKELLPEDSVVLDREDERVKRYRRYLYIVSSVSIFLLMLIVGLFILYEKNKKLRHKLEINREELIEAKEKAEESDRLKSAFLANMSHEIRTPLNSIVGFSNLLISDEFSEEERKEMNKVIAQNSKLLLTLITDILDISGLETGKLNFVFKTTDLNILCQQVFATIHHIKKPAVNYRFEPEKDGLTINTDSHRLSQVLLNLLTNANKFTEKGEIVLKYQLTDNNKKILFSVTDTGIGIPKEQHDKLFERFGKLDTFRQGAGLGLAISKQIVTRLGGRIWIDSDYTRGARFFFSHPL